MSKNNLGTFWRELGLAVILVSSAYFVRSGITWAAGATLPPYITFYPAVMLAGLVGGLRLGLLATALTLVTTFFFIPLPDGGLAVLNASDVVGLAIFSGTSILMNLICGRYLLMRNRMADLVERRTREFERSRQSALDSLEQAVQARQKAEQAEAMLREREQQLRLFVEYSPAAIAMLNSEMRYLAVSRRWLLDYKLKDQNIIGRSHYEVFPQIPERWKAIHHRCLAGAVEKCDAEPFLRADGMTDWVRWEIHPWRKDDGRIDGLILFSEVITERKLAEENLRRGEENYRQIFNATSDAIFVHEAATGRVLDVNDVMLRMHGYDSKAEYLQEQAERVLTKDTRETMRTGCPALCNNSQADPRAVSCREAMSHLGIQSCAAFPLRLQGQIVAAFRVCTNEPGFFGAEENRLLEKIAFDVSSALDRLEEQEQRRQAESALQKAEEFKKAVLDSVTSHIAVLDCNGVIVAVNERWNESARANPLDNGMSPRHVEVGDNYLEICRQSQEIPRPARLPLTTAFARCWMAGRRCSFWNIPAIPLGKNAGFQ